MKRIENMSEGELAKMLETSGFTVEEAKPAVPPVAKWKDGSLRDAEAAFDWERFSADQNFFEKSHADGSYAAAVAARSERLRAEQLAAERAEHEERLKEKIAALDALDAEIRAAEDAREEKRLAGVVAPKRKGT